MGSCIAKFHVFSVIEKLYVMLIIDLVKLQDEVGGELGPAAAVLGIVKPLVMVEFIEAV